MPNLLAMSFEGELAPSFDLRCLQPGRTLPDGWGIGYYPGGEPSATVLKEPAPPPGSIRSELVKAWEHLESSLFLLHVRHATWGAATGANTQPFQRAYGRRDWLFAHSGSLRERPTWRPNPLFEAVGSTDTEAVLCDLLGRIAERGWSSLGEVDLDVLLGWFGSLNELGTLSSVLADGHDLVVYADRDPGATGIWVREVRPPYDELRLGDEDLVVDLTSRGAKSRKGILVCSDPLAVTADGAHVAGQLGAAWGGWRKLSPGTLLTVRQGAVRDERVRGEGAPQSSLPGVRSRHLTQPEPAPPRSYDVVHRTVYGYEKSVERSSHLFRLRPSHDPLQTLHRFELACSVDGTVRDYDDVFGNHTRRLQVDRPFDQMVVVARSRVEVLDTDPLSYRALRASTTIPLTWMPWQRQVLQPFLLPEELPESQLSELVEYAMSFVTRNDRDLIETLLDINETIHREYAYVQGVTNLATTPFETYANRRGVCQDFTNLFMCLCRLLSIPARYVCGYLYTGPKHENRLQSEASHAWAQVYVPEVGWRGFDPTNGLMTQTAHVRVSVGRSWRDATPTSGTIYVGGGGETLEADVAVDPVVPDAPWPPPADPQGSTSRPE